MTKETLIPVRHEEVAVCQRQLKTDPLFVSVGN